MDNKEKVTFNTIVLYGRLLISAIISLYTARVVLVVLGVSDYGIISLVGSVVGMLGFLNAALSVSTQRFLSYNIGKDDISIQNDIFSCGLLMHISFGLLISSLLLISLPLVFNHLIIVPFDRVDAAKIIYFIVISTTFLSIASVPFSATLNSHENMLADSLIFIISDIFKLLGVIFLQYIQIDKLILYGLVILLCSIIEFGFRYSYCYFHYEETHFRKDAIKISTLKEMLSFSLWNAYGGFVLMLRNQGVAIVINRFAGVVANAAYGISSQVSNTLRNVSESLKKSLNPQIMKNEGAGNHDNMVRLSLYQSKYTFLLIYLLVQPLFIDIDFILQAWLVNVPEYASKYCRLILVVLLIQQPTNGLQSAINATGKIKVYQIVICTIIAMSVILAYFFLSIGMPSYYSIVSMLIVEIICFIIRPLFAAKYAGVPLKLFIVKTVLPILAIFIPSSALTYFLFLVLPFNGEWATLLFLVAYSSIIIICISYLFMSKEEKRTFIDLFKKTLEYAKIKNNNRQN